MTTTEYFIIQEVNAEKRDVHVDVSNTVIFELAAIITPMATY